MPPKLAWIVVTPTDPDIPPAYCWASFGDGQIPGPLSEAQQQQFLDDKPDYLKPATVTVREDPNLTRPRFRDPNEGRSQTLNLQNPRVTLTRDNGGLPPLPPKHPLIDKISATLPAHNDLANGEVCFDWPNRGNDAFECQTQRYEHNGPPGPWTPEFGELVPPAWGGNMQGKISMKPADVENGGRYDFRVRAKPLSNDSAFVSDPSPWTWATVNFPPSRTPAETEAYVIAAAPTMLLVWIRANDGGMGLQARTVPAIGDNSHTDGVSQGQAFILLTGLTPVTLHAFQVSVTTGSLRDGRIVGGQTRNIPLKGVTTGYTRWNIDKGEKLPFDV